MQCQKGLNTQPKPLTLTDMYKTTSIFLTTLELLSTDSRDQDF